MASDEKEKIIAALNNRNGDTQELEELLAKYGISARDEKGEWRSTIEILKDVAEYKSNEKDN